MHPSLGVLVSVEQQSCVTGDVERMRATLATMLDNCLALTDALEGAVGGSREQAMVREKLDEAVLWLAAGTPEIRWRAAQLQMLDLSRL